MKFGDFMSIDSNITGITGIGGMGGGAATIAAELAGTGHSVAIGLTVGMVIVVISAFVMRKAHRDIIAN